METILTGSGWINLNQVARFSPLRLIRADEVRLCTEWLALNPIIKGKENQSYPLKHRVEEWANTYISNGALIWAALDFGYRHKRVGVNSEFYPKPDLTVTLSAKGWIDDRFKPIEPVCPKEVELCQQWLVMHPISGRERYRHSHQLKHQVEEWVEAHISNGALIQAALNLGYKHFRRGPDSVFRNTAKAEHG